MNISAKATLPAAETSRQTGRRLAARERVLEVACEMFAETGFYGTHFREICKRSGTNVAGLCYHFQSKEGLYEAVLMEAGRRLSERHQSFPDSSDSPEQRLLMITASLLETLGARRAWIAKLLIRELVDRNCGGHTYAASGLERDFVLLQAVMKDLIAPDIDAAALRLHALQLIAQCVFYSLAGENPMHPLSQLAVSLPAKSHLARCLSERWLRCAKLESAAPKPSIA